MSSGQSTRLVHRSTLPSRLWKNPVYIDNLLNHLITVKSPQSISQGTFQLQMISAYCNVMLFLCSSAGLSDKQLLQPADALELSGDRELQRNLSRFVMYSLDTVKSRAGGLWWSV